MTTADESVGAAPRTEATHRLPAWVENGASDRFRPIALLRDLWTYRELARTFAASTLRVRYKQAAFGVSWAILQPLSLMVAFTLVFSRFAQVPSDGVPYPIFSYTALVPWTFLANALTTATIGLVSQRSVVTKTYFPREVIVLSQVGARFVDFLAAGLVLAGMLVWYGWSR